MHIYGNCHTIQQFNSSSCCWRRNNGHPTLGVPYPDAMIYVWWRSTQHMLHITHLPTISKLMIAMGPSISRLTNLHKGRTISKSTIFLSLFISCLAMVKILASNTTLPNRLQKAVADFRNQHQIDNHHVLGKLHTYTICRSVYQKMTFNQTSFSMECTATGQSVP